MKSARIKAGDVFSRWTVLSKAVSRKTPGGSCRPYWLCRCECGSVVEVQAGHLRHGRSASCGCLQKEIAAAASFKHGYRHSPLYDVWVQLIQRCENTKNKSYKNYGARGIKVCAEWHDYVNFLLDMGADYKPGLTIDRKDNDGNYEPGNCRWVTNKVNCRNQQRSIRVEWNGALVALNDLAEAHGVKLLTAYSRYRLKGWTLRQSLGLDAPPPLVRKPYTNETRARMVVAALKREAKKRETA